jgi:cellulose synthase/poly-beta-1,6-N-acetylglucosamine synthase-like glycosyltransferase
MRKPARTAALGDNMNETACVIIPVGPGHEELVSWQIAALSRQRGGVAFVVYLADNTISGLRGFQVSAVVTGAISEIVVIDCREALGVSQVRNMAVAATAAPRILFCDADDIVGDRWVGGMLSALDSADIAGGLFCNSLELRPTQVGSSMKGHCCRPTGPVSHEGIEIASGGNFGANRSALLELGGWDESMLRAQDVDMSLRATRRGYRVAFASSAFLHRMHQRVASNARRPSSDYLTGVYRRRIARRHGIEWRGARTLTRPFAVRGRLLLRQGTLRPRGLAVSQTFACALGELAEHLLPERAGQRLLQRRRHAREASMAVNA